MESEAEPTRRHSVSLRAPKPATAAALVTALCAAGTTIAFLVAAQVIASDNCGGSGCVPGSAWAPGGSAAAIQLGLAWSALPAAAGLVWAVGMARRRTAKLMWTVLFGLLLDWCVFSSAIASPLAVLGLLFAGGGGLLGISLATGHRVHALLAFARRVHGAAEQRRRRQTPTSVRPLGG